MVKITIYSFIIADEENEKTYPYNKGIIILSRPYSFDFIKIENIGVEGYTKKPVFDTILSKELRKQIKVITPNRTNNLYLRNVYTIDNIPVTRKNYDYFTYFPEMAQKNHSGLEIAVNPELLRKYIPDHLY
jgi:hypothetical protein